MEQSKSSFIIRSYQEGDELKINEMFNEVFNQSRALSHWYWKYRDNPYGSYTISLALSSEETLAAHYGGYPVKLYFCPSSENPPAEITTYHLGDKMTRRQFRKVGFGKTALLSEVFSHFKKTFALDGIPFGYGFGTHHSLKFGLMFLDYSDIEPVVYRKLDFNLLRTRKISLFERVASGDKVTEISNIDASWTDFFHRVASSYKYLAKRDATYLKWRYLERPDRKYFIISIKRKGKLYGWSVFFRDKNKIVWGDALYAPADIKSVRSTLAYLVTHPISDGADFTECWFPQRPAWWDDILNRLGFRIETEPNKLHLTGPVFNDKNSPEVLRKYFYYTMGDSDLF